MQGPGSSSIFLLHFIFTFQTYNILILHLNLTNYVNGNMNLGQKISKIKVIQAEQGHAVYKREI